MKIFANMLVWVGLLCFAPLVHSAPVAVPTEYRLKAAILYNFALFTEWPETVGKTLKLCTVGSDPIHEAWSALNGKAVGARSIEVVRSYPGQSFADCHIVFISKAAMANLPALLQELRLKPALTVADTPGAAKIGVALNMAVINNRVAFEVNPRAARAAGLTLSSRLLRLATEVHH